MSSKEYFQSDKPKDPSTPVYPVVRSRVEFLKGMIAGYVLGEPCYAKDPGWGTPHTNLPGWKRFVYACNIVSADCGSGEFTLDPVIQAYDLMHNSQTVVLGEDLVSSYPAWGDPAVGYRPIMLGEKVMYFDGTAWVPRWLADPRRKGDTLLLAESDEADADSEWVGMWLVSREPLGAPKKPKAPEPPPPAVELVWEN